jgi:hypothetical protein
MIKKTLVKEENEWRDPHGQMIHLCAIDEITSDHSVAAITTIGGLSMCRLHFEKTVMYLKMGKPMTAVILDALEGVF